MNACRINTLRGIVTVPYCVLIQHAYVSALQHTNLTALRVELTRKFLLCIGSSSIFSLNLILEVWKYINIASVPFYQNHLIFQVKNEDFARYDSSTATFKSWLIGLIFFFYFFFILKEGRRIFGKVMGVFVRIIEPLAEAI
jgi:hypothetical protein